MKLFANILLGFLFMTNIIFPQYQQKKLEVDSLLSAYNNPDTPGAALMVIKNGNILYEHGYGLANLEEKIPVETNTNFRLASVTKEFTATAIMILINRGKLNLKDNLKDIFPAFPAYGRKITIKNLLNHTSGLIDYEDLISDTATIQVKDKDVLKMMMEQDSTYFDPGSQYRYCNTGYAVLAMIIEKITGQSFPEFLKENIFQPLKMDNTIAYEKGVSEVKNRAFGYSYKDSAFIRTDQSLTSAVLGDGGIYSSVEDLYKWDQELYTEKLLPKVIVQKSFTRSELNNGEKIDYGFGWHLKTFIDHQVIYHTGSTKGFRNVIYRIPDLNFTVILLTNRDEGDMENLAEKIVSIYLGNS